MPIKAGSMGLPAPGYEVKIVDDDGNLLGPNQEGHIAVRVPKEERPIGLFRDYWKDDELTQKVFHNGWYFTQDKAYYDEDGYFWYVGRADDVFKSSGYRIGPFEVESTLIEHPSVVEAAVIGVPDPEGIRGFLIKAFVVLAKSYTPSDQLVAELKEHCKARASHYKCPHLIEFVTELPKTISGKIRRTELRQKEREKKQSL